MQSRYHALRSLVTKGLTNIALRFLYAKQCYVSDLSQEWPCELRLTGPRLHLSTVRSLLAGIKQWHGNSVGASVTSVPVNSEG